MYLYICDWKVKKKMLKKFDVLCDQFHIADNQ
jgi:hypothetical protein